jgi:hypothetical protein
MLNVNQAINSRVPFYKRNYDYDLKYFADYVLIYMIFENGFNLFKENLELYFLKFILAIYFQQ